MGMPGIITMAPEEWPAIGLAQTGDNPPSINARTTVTLPKMPRTALVMVRCYTPRARHSRRSG